VNTPALQADAASRRVVTPLESETDIDDSAPFRAPRRRAVQAFAWGVPLVVGGLLATYLATAEQRARSGPSLHSVQPGVTETRAATDSANVDKPVDAKDSLEGLPTGSANGPILGGAHADELAQAAGGTPPRAALSDAAGTSAERGLSAGAARSTSTSSASKKPTDSKSKSRTSTRPVAIPVKPAEILAVPQQQSDPDVGF
jgi:hypothetical protein